MSFKYDVCVFIARAQVPHNGHLNIIRTALELGREVIVLLGSADAAISMRNPLPAWLRAGLIEEALADHPLAANLNLVHMPDVLYNDTLWVQEVQKHVYQLVESMGLELPDVTRAKTSAAGRLNSKRARITLIGCRKDSTSYYLGLFPSWDAVPVAPYMLHGSDTPLSSTYLRDNFVFSLDGLHGIRDMEGLTHPSVINTLATELPNYCCPLRKRTIHDIVLSEKRYEREYKGQFKSIPFDLSHTTVDAVVIQSGHVLMIERADDPGKGLLALPGGFVQQDGSLRQNAIRELIEETRLKVPEKVLNGSYVTHREFDYPLRSIRGRIVTHAYLFKLEDKYELPRVYGASDAKKAMWVPLGSINPRHCYEDHYHILQRMLQRLPE